MRTLLSALVLVGSLLPQIATSAHAAHCGPEAGGLTCTDIGGTDVGGDCTLNAIYVCDDDTIINIPGSLIISAGNGIDCGGANGGTGANGTPAFDLALNVGYADGLGDLEVSGFITADGGGGGSGGNSMDGGAGALGGDIDIDVCGDVTLQAGSVVSALGGAGGPGGSGVTATPNGGNGMAGGPGGTINIDADLTLTQASGAFVDAAGGAGGTGGAGAANNGNGGAGAAAGVGGAVVIFSCATDIGGSVGAAGGTGGSGGGGNGTLGGGGANGNGAAGGTVDVLSGSNLLLQSTATLRVSGGNEGAVGEGNPGGANNAVGGNGGTVTTNNCPDFETLDSGATFATNGGLVGGVNGMTVPLETAPCCPCAIDIDKQVAPDDNCDGTADGAFSDLEQQQFDQCVVYRICVTNTSGTGAGVNDRPQVIEDVFVDDTHLGIDDADFGNLDPGQEECRLVPSEAPATECPGPSGDANDDTCVCEDVVGENTAVVDQALCAVDASDPCTDQPPSDCSDTAEVECITPCSVTIDKKVAADANCDGVEEGAFSDFVQMPIDQCVVYRICVKNTGDQNLNGTGVLVSDAHLNITDLNFGTIAPDAEVCKDVPGDASVGDCAGGTCVCRTVEGPNTATITSAICEDNQANACQQVGSVCEDPAEVDCIDTPCTLDHFKCYKTRTDGSFVPRDVTLADQFESTSALVEKPVRFCNPANKNNEGINDPTAHLMCYDINQATPFQPRHVLVNNQFGEQELVVTKPYQLCNPATKDGVGNFEELDLDHMKCYRVRRAVGSPRVNPTITVQDQFETRTAQVFRPHILCNPVSKNNSGIRNDECHLVCYRLRASLPIFRSQPITVEDQFSSQSLDALRGVCGSVDYVCLPSSKTELD